MRHLRRTLGIAALWFLLELVITAALAFIVTTAAMGLFGELEKHPPQHFFTAKPEREPLPDPFQADWTLADPPATRP